MRGSAATIAAAVALSAMMPARAADCNHDRACLAQVMDAYVQAVLKHDPGALPTRRNVKYTENGVRLDLGDGLWQTAAAPPTYRLDIIDEEAGQVGLLGRISENGNNNWFAVRLKVENDGKVSQIETLLNRSATGGGGGAPAANGRPAGSAPMPAAPRQNTEPAPLMAEVIPEGRRAPRAALAAAGNAYFTGMADEDSSRNVPFSPQCQRRENGTVTANNPDAPQGSMQWLDCKSQYDTGFSVIVTNIRERRFEVVDRTKGLAFGWGYFDHDGTHAKFTHTPDHQLADVPATFRQPITFYIAEVFKVVDGQIRQIEAVLTTVPFRMESGW